MPDTLTRLIERNVRLGAECRFGVGGPADYFARVSSATELIQALQFAREHRLDYFIYAGGSNLFFDDNGFRGLVIRMMNGGWRLDEVGASVKVSAGYDLPKLVRELGRQGWGGIEFLGNIPGSVGGAVVGNAGCYGRSITEILTAAEVYLVAEDKLITVGPEWFEFRYRHSKLKYDPNGVVVSAVLKLVRRAPEEILSEVEEELNARLGKHPHDAMCAGSFFKNPSMELPAWKVITEVGMAEAQIGDAQLSPRHANFLVNNGHATATEIIALARQVQQAVKEKLGISLEPEVRYVGERGIEEVNSG